MKRLLIIGAGGFGREVLGWAQDIPAIERDWEVAGFLDYNPEALNRFGCPFPILGDPATYSIENDDRFICAIGNPQAKLRISRDLQQKGAQFITLVHPSAIIGPRSHLGEGCIVCPGSVVTADVRVGSFVALNVQTTIGHDATIGDGCTLSGHCDVTGHVKLGECVFMGSHASILPNTVVGDHSIIGAGSVVLRKVKPHTTVMGVPARQIAGFTERHSI